MAHNTASGHLKPLDAPIEPTARLGISFAASWDESVGFLSINATSMMDWKTSEISASYVVAQVRAL
jgi:hypothetical protein